MESKTLLKMGNLFNKFEIRIWILSNSTRNTMLITNIIKKSIDTDQSQVN